jgi:hypothetical protein
MHELRCWEKCFRHRRTYVFELPRRGIRVVFWFSRMLRLLKWPIQRYERSHKLLELCGWEVFGLTWNGILVDNMHQLRPRFIWAIDWVVALFAVSRGQVRSNHWDCRMRELYRRNVSGIAGRD